MRKAALVKYVWIFIGFLGLSFGMASGQNVRDAIVFVEGYDSLGTTVSRGIGVMVKKGFVAVNYHLIAGMHEIGVFRPGQTKKTVSDGYLSVEEEKDLIIISAPGLEGGSYADMAFGQFPEDGTQVSFFHQPEFRQLREGKAKVSGNKELLELTLPQLITKASEDLTNGPVYLDGKLQGFVVAGYLDDVYYAYVMPVAELRRLTNRSFIIKSFNSLTDQRVIGNGYFQKNLMENLHAVLWMPLPDAERLARRKSKMILIDVTTDWSGWSKLMNKNTYSSKKVIRYINENFYAVRLNAESEATITFNNLAYSNSGKGRYHTLAYSLLEGKMDFPSTVILDEDISVLLVIPGYMDTRKMEVVLHYFSEKAYLNTGKTFQDFESEFWSR